MSRLLVANWKMNLGPSQAKAFVGEFEIYAKRAKKTEVWIAPPFASIDRVTQSLPSDSSIVIGAQNVHWEKDGAFTGEVSAQMLKDLGCRFALVGHSERRHVFGEGKQHAAQRALFGLSQGIKIIFCIGETLAERKAGHTKDVLESQLTPLLENIPTDSTCSLIIAYEPVWAIGTGVPATLNEIADAHNDIHSIWAKSQKAQCPPILYGGSATAENCRDILAIPLVSGALVGKASLTVATFAALLSISESL